MDFFGWQWLAVCCGNFLMIVGKYRTFLGGSESLWDFVGGVVGKNWLWNSCGL